MTGAGTVINVAHVNPHTEVIVMGLGGVGLGALMAAKVAGCKTIIAVDRVESRLELARELGATHTLNTSGKIDLTEKLGELARKVSMDGCGVNLAIDTTTYIPLVEAGIESLTYGGQMIMLGIPLPTDEMSIKPGKLLSRALSIRSAILGDALPAEFVPKMVEWYRKGLFPVEKLVRYFKAEDVNDAVQAMHDGSAVKPVLLW